MGSLREFNSWDDLDLMMDDIFYVEAGEEYVCAMITKAPSYWTYNKPLHKELFWEAEVLFHSNPEYPRGSRITINCNDKPGWRFWKKATCEKERASWLL